MALGRKFKTKDKRTTTSSSAPTQVDRIMFPTNRNEEIFETLTKYRSIQGEGQTVLYELDPSICRSQVSRNWVSLCDVSHPPPTTIIREFYSNLSILSVDTGCHYLTTWIRGKEFKITKHIVFEALGVPLVYLHIHTLNLLLQMM